MMQTSETFVTSEGFKISLVIVRTQDGLVMSRYQVQSPENKAREARGERTIGGDCLLATLDAAQEYALFEYKQYQEHHQFLFDIASKELAEAAIIQAKKEANRCKTIAERARDARLDKPTKLPVQAGLGTGTARDSMASAVEQGRAIVQVKVFDLRAKNNDKKVVEHARTRGYILGLSNENIPEVKNGLAAHIRLKENVYECFEYRVYAGSKPEGGFYEITKTEFDYAKELQNGQ